ncbi:MAG: hypothetical protein JW776_14435 [Candidatus Lokiarchaeota archaeon]|nr:hypothetical protein [Candidatus Lokiarchaeota archaeon]
MNTGTIISTIFGVILGFIAFIIGFWYLLRFILRIIAAKHVDGSYIYDKTDFQADGLTPIEKKLSKQDNHFGFNFDNTTLYYDVQFGSKRAFKYGVVRVHHKGSWYSTHPQNTEKKIIFQERKVGNSEPLSFTNLQSKNKSISIEWILEGSSIRVITHFSLFMNGILSIQEPDLKYSSVEENELNFIVFSIEFPDGLENTTTNNFNIPCIQFPVFFNDSPNRRVLCFKNRKFSPPSQQILPTSGPVTLFDENLNTIVISAMDQFVTHLTGLEGSDARVSHFKCGLNGEIKEIPESHQSHYILLFDNGINNSLYRLGDILRSYHRKSRRSMLMDSFTSQLGYWTDNGAQYYYKPLKNASMSETLITLDRYAEQMGIPISNYNLDSWWYRKDVKKWKRTLLGPIGRLIGGALYGGTIEWDTDPDMMNHSIIELKKQLNKPLNCHARWFSNNTIYKEMYPFIVEGNKSLCIEPEFWDMIMKQCKEYGIDNYEQDWMSTQFDSLSFLRNTVGNTKKWLISMGDAAKKYDRTIEYCMTTSGMFLSSIYVEPVSFIRTCDDYNPQWPRNWDYKFFVQTNILAHTVRACPFKDVFLSKTSGWFSRERQPELMALVSALSCGPVGLGDRINEFGVENIFKTCRKDGYLIKPDRPLTATDSMFVPHSKYFLATTYSDHDKLRWWYVVQSKLTVKQPRDLFFRLEDIGIEEQSSQFIAYNYFQNTIRQFSENYPIETMLRGQEYNYWVLAPVLTDGFALIGDLTKFVVMSFQIFDFVEWKENELHLTLKSIKGEPFHLLFYDVNRIKSVSINGKSLKQNSLNWIVDEERQKSIILHEFDSDSCKIVVKVQ